jgi:hypothetical protein
MVHDYSFFGSTADFVIKKEHNSEETPVVQILNPNNSDNDVQLVEPVKDTATSEIATDITETPIQHARKRALSGQQIQAGLKFLGRGNIGICICLRYIGGDSICCITFTCIC